MSDVVSRVLYSLDPALRNAGSSLGEVLSEHDLSPVEFWAHPGRRIPWNIFADVLENAGERLGGLQALEDIGANSLIWNWQTIIGVVSRYVTPFTVFQLGVKWFCPVIFKGIRGFLEEIPNGLIETVVIPRERRDSPEFFALSRGVMRQCPTIIGWETTELEFTHYDHRGEYRMKFERTGQFRRSSPVARQEESSDRDLEELSILGLEMIAPADSAPDQTLRGGSLAARARATIRSENAEAALTAAGVAGRLGMSERSLARQLASEGTSFRVLRDEVLCEIAIAQIRTGTPIRAIGNILGFADNPSFYRAFRRWTGHPPGHYKLANESPLSLA